MKHTEYVNEWIRETVEQREIVRNALKGFSYVKTVYPGDANFVLVKVDDADTLYEFLAANEIVVRNRSSETGCENCLRISIGTPEENEQLLSALKKYQS